MDSVFDKAIADYYKNSSKDLLLINNHYGQADEMPLEVYFRDEGNLNGLESYALSLCAGKVLDVGVLSLILQNRGIDTDALELSEACCEIMHLRGVDNVVNRDFFTGNFTNKYDTLLIMMNGFWYLRNHR